LGVSAAVVLAGVILDSACDVSGDGSITASTPKQPIQEERMLGGRDSSTEGFGAFDELTDFEPLFDVD